ncbi:MAG: ATP-binding protein [Myxococcales bacterium]|nr:ATP-binding protein [Myxococcales bacterium]MCB9735044.1 ATP-binding protein [Deltaproteobacteria bacterium]
MTAAAPPLRHNPGFLPDDELVAGFVVREAELAALVETVRENTGAASIQHVLLVGRRGAGKTTLLRRVAAEITRDAALADAWQPIRFGEEAYGVSSVGELWLEALRHVAEASGDGRWSAAHAELRTERDERRLQTLALGRLLDFSEEHDKQLLILVENLQLLLGGGQIGAEGAWALRHTLQNEPRVMLLGSATARFDAITDRRQALFDLFDVRELPPLEDAAVRSLWTHVAGEDLAGRRVRPVAILTGGNPRLVANLAAWSGGGTPRDLMPALRRLLDDQTAWLKAHVEDLPPQERKVFSHLADLWHPATAREVAAEGRLEVNVVSANLKRLVGRGLVAEVGSAGRARYYEVAERMVNLWHLVRAGGAAEAQVTALVAFMGAFYAERLADVPTLDGAALTARLAARPALAEAVALTLKAAATGAARDLGEVVAAGPMAAGLRPVGAALRLLAGEVVREPREVMEVAADVRRRLEDTRAT